MARSRSRIRLVMGLVAVAMIAGLVWFGCGRDRGDVTAPVNPPPSLSLAGQQQDFGPAIAAQRRHTERLLRIAGVVGTAVGLTSDGRPAVQILTKAAGIAGVPSSLDGIPVVVQVTGEFFALQGQGTDRPSAGKGRGGGSKIDPTSRFARPVPIGVSTGNEGQCSAGTISARVKDAANVYALSNNHVYALENAAPPGSNVLQPGLFDTGCVFDPNNVIGTLSDFQAIDFSGASNTIDAAIAVSSTANLGNATPSNGYGTPKSATVSAFVGQAVQKYGRTSSLTKGTVTMISATVNVTYSSGTALFVDQTIVQSNKPFLKAGDSGSLLVTDPDANPVGLLFAGTSSGTLAVANRIDLVLTRFNVTVDGAP